MMTMGRELVMVLYMEESLISIYRILDYGRGWRRRQTQQQEGNQLTDNKFN